MKSNTISLDLRIRILDACDRHDGTQRQIAERFQVSFAFVKKLLGQRNHLGIIDNLYFRVGRKRLLSEEQQERMRTYIKAHPGATLAEIAAACHLDCTIATVDNTLRRMGLTYKKDTSGFRTGPGRCCRRTSGVERAVAGMGLVAACLHRRIRRHDEDDPSLRPVHAG